MRKSRFWIALTVALLALTLLCVGTALADIPASGYCGEYESVYDDATGTWIETNKAQFTYADGKLTITGSGEIYSGNIFPTTSDKLEVTTAEIKGNITKLGWGFFSECKSLESVTLPNSITEFEGSVFSNCTELSDINIPTGLTTIGSDAFYNCTSLTTVSLPSGLKTIDGWAFQNCQALESIDLPNGLTTINNGAFYNCSSLTGDLVIPESVSTIGNSAFCSVGYESIVFPTKITKIPESVCSGCANLESVEFKGSITSIGQSAFSGCSKLKTLDIPATVTSVGEYAYDSYNTTVYADLGSDLAIALSKAKCAFTTSDSKFRFMYLFTKKAVSGLQLVKADQNCTVANIPDGVTVIGESAFSECDKLTGVSIPATVTNIGGWAFCNCSDLASVAFTTSVSSIGESAFNYNLQNIFYTGTESDRNGISVGKYNDGMANAVWHYGESAPADLVNIWDYDYAWDFNKGKVTATATCKNNHDHVITETVNCWYSCDEEKGQKTPTCTEAGICDYWSDCFTNRCFPQQQLQQTDVEIPALGHDYTVREGNQPKYSWAIDNSEAYASLQCCRCWDEKATLIETAIPTVQVSGGTKTYTAVFTDPRFETQTKEVVAGRDRTPPQLKKVTLESKELSKPGILYVTLDFVEEESGLVDCYINTCEIGKTNSTGYGSNSWYDNPQFTGSVTLEVPINTKFPAGNHYISYISLTDSQENRISYQVDTWYYSPTGEYNMDELVARDEGGTYAIIARVPINNGFTVSEDSISDFEYLVTAPSLIGEIENIPQGGHGVILFNYNQHTAPAELFDAMKGKDATFTFSNNDLQWRWKGTDLTKASKDVDLWVDSWTESGEPYGLTDDVLVIRFADNGELPGPVTMRIKSDYYFKIHGMSTAAYLYFQDGENIYNESSGVTAVLDKNDHWCEFTVSHNSTFIITSQPIKEAKEQTYKVTFKANGGKGTMKALKAESGKKVKLTANKFTKKGYVFAGWNTKKNGKGTAYKDGAKITLKKNITLYAQWDKIALKMDKVSAIKQGKDLKLSVTLKIGGKAVKGKKVTFTFNGKKYTAKTDKKGVAKVTIKKAVTKKLKVGKKVKISAAFGGVTVNATAVVKK